MEEHPNHHCKNCSTEIDGNFCAFCGQRYHAHKESFGELVYEFISDFVHFDSRFFKTVLPLIFNPGKLTKSYNEGRQRSQFHPIRLYMFSSFVYFFLFFSFNNIEGRFENTNNEVPVVHLKDSIAKLKGLDSSGLTTAGIPSAMIVKKADSVPSSTEPTVSKKGITVTDNQGLHYTLSSSTYLDSLLEKNATPEAYMAQQKTMPENRKDGYIQRIINVRLLKINLEGESGKKEFFKKLNTSFFHNIPKMLFFLLPLFALILKLLYIRREQFFYVDHAVLSLHYFSFIFLMLVFSNYILDNIFGTAVFTQFAVVWIFVYLLVAMKKLYGQSWRKTILKYFSLLFLFFLVFIMTLIGNMAFSVIMM